MASSEVKKPITQKKAIKSFLYFSPKAPKPIEVVIEEKTLVNVVQTKKPIIKKSDEKTIEKPQIKQQEIEPKKATNLPIAVVKNPEPSPSPKKLDSFTKLQRLRSKLNRSSIAPIDNPYQRYQSPSVFNTQSKTVPHSVPLKDEEKERQKNTKNMGAGIAITKNDDGTCSITQDMSLYGLSEGSSTQYFNCGESKFDKSFREHMKKVKTKLGK